MADRSQLLVIDSFAITETAPLDDSTAVITQTAAVTGALGALVYETPGGAVIGVLPSRTLDADTVVPVVEAANDGAWVRVMLPSRHALPSSGQPVNGSTGWIWAGEATLAPTTASVVVDLTSRTVSVLDASGAVTFTSPVAIGAAATPTPTNVRGYLASKVTGNAHVPRVMALSLHSGALDTFEDGPAVIAIHTVHGLATSGAVSNGCVRGSDALLDVIEALPAGTPISLAGA